MIYIIDWKKWRKFALVIKELKKKISAKNVERLIDDLFIQKKEENRFMKSGLGKVWKKIDLIDD